MSGNQQTIYGLPMHEEIQKYLEDLIVDAKLGKADPAIKEMMLNDLSERLNKYLLMAMAKALSEQELETYTALAEVDQSQALAYLHDVKPEMPKIILQALADFRQMFLKA
ncbi:MAG: hypothetical protein M1383_03130 [Patescibacteria group bacterium]|nr:hypothetical protein [Patescibacteria group bacterium]